MGVFLKAWLRGRVALAAVGRHGQVALSSVVGRRLLLGRRRRHHVRVIVGGLSLRVRRGEVGRVGRPLRRRKLVLLVAELALLVLPRVWLVGCLAGCHRALSSLSLEQPEGEGGDDEDTGNG